MKSPPEKKPPAPDLSRRQFLVQSAGLAGASLGLGTARGEGADCVRLGFIGIGDRGRHLLGAALQTARARVAALCDVDPLRLRQALDIAADHRPRGFTNYRALLDAGAVDAVFIATPGYQHPTQALTALAAEKHVYCEKPMALNAADLRELTLACRRSEAKGQVFQIGLQRRYSPRYRRSIQFIHSGEAGEVRSIRAQWHSVGAARKTKPWFFRREKSGDIVLEQACHQFDIFNWVFAAPPLRACALGSRGPSRKTPPGRDILDDYGAVLEYPGGRKVYYSHLTYSIPERRFAGIYELAFCEKTGVDLANALTWDENGHTRRLCPQGGNDTQLAVEAFVASVVTGKPPAAGAEVGCQATFAALLCARAIASERQVRWEEVATG